MPTVTSCPETGVLERLLLGRISADDANPLEAHVLACAHCTTTLQQLRADDPLVEALRRTPAYEQDNTPFVQALIPCLKRLLPNDPERTQAEAARPSAAPATVAHFDFLAAPQASDELGRLGGYRVLKVLGEGGMGVVFLADDPRLKRRIALKAIKPELVQRREIRERFLREAQAIARVEHDNIVTIFQVDEERGVPFLAMPLLRGEALEQRLQRAAGPLPLDETLRIGREIAAGLAAAHDQGLVHRDIKPGNIFLSVVRSPSSVDVSTTADPEKPDGPVKVKILDFGLARAVRADADELSQPGQILGTPMYMAPEQGQGVKVDYRADLFSLGCILYRMATGEAPFRGTEFMTIMLSVAMDAPTPLHKLNPELPPALRQLIERLLAKTPEKRPQSAHAVVGALEAIERQRAGAGRPQTSRRGLLLAAATVLLGASALAAGVSWWATRAPAPPPEQPGEVTFEFDEAEVPLALRRGDEAEQALDLRDGHAHRLAPGWYQIHPTMLIEKRHLVPADFEVKEGAVLRLKLRLVGEVRNSRAVHDHPVVCVAVAPKKGDLTILSASLDGRVGVWRPFAKPPEDTVSFLEGHTSEVRAVAFAPDGKLAASGGGGRNPRTNDRTIRLWDVSDGKLTDQLPRHASWVEALAFAPDGKHLLSAAHDGSISWWDLAAHTKIDWRPADGHGVYSVTFSADGKQALTGGDTVAILWSVADGEELRRLEGHDGMVRGALFGPGAGEVTTACDDGLIRVWNLKGEKVRELHGHRDAVTSLALSPDGKRFVSGSRDGTVRLWSAATGREEYAFETGNAVNSVAFTADGRRAVSGGADRGMRLWELPP